VVPRNRGIRIEHAKTRLARISNERMRVDSQSRRCSFHDTATGYPTDDESVVQAPAGRAMHYVLEAEYTNAARHVIEGNRSRTTGHDGSRPIVKR
jgi:hypothetical protein